MPRTSRRDLLAYGDPAGYAPLREAIAAYLRTARAVDCDASAGDHPLRLADGTAGCGDVADHRGFGRVHGGTGIPRGASRARHFGSECRPDPGRRDGIDVAAINRLGRRARSSSYVTPSHQYPLGVSMAVSRRLELLGWAERNNAWILEDDYDSEYRYSSRPLGALQGMDTNGRVIYLGTFSKVLFPAIRLGYAGRAARAGHALRPHARNVRSLLADALSTRADRLPAAKDTSRAICAACAPCTSPPRRDDRGDRASTPATCSPSATPTRGCISSRSCPRAPTTGPWSAPRRRETVSDRAVHLLRQWGVATGAHHRVRRFG